jgi:RHS repeat-associated protein
VIAYDGFGLPATVTRTSPALSERTRAAFSGDGLLASLVLTARETAREEERSASVQYRWSTDALPQILSQRVAPHLDDAEHDESGRLSAEFTYGYGRAFASWARGKEPGAATFARDALGSAVRTDDTADWVRAAAYQVFGEPAEPWEHGGRGPELPRFGYRGELSLGRMLYLRARTYDTVLGRFTTPDPLILPPGQAGTARFGNLYAYTGNDPLNFTDPSGQFSIPGIFHEGLHVLDIGRHDVASTFDRARHGLASALDKGRHDVAHYAGTIARDTMHELDIPLRGLERNFDGLRHAVASLGHALEHVFDLARHDVAHTVDEYVGAAVIAARAIARAIEGCKPVYRGMKFDGDNRPVVGPGRTTLGARPGPGPGTDIPVGKGGIVRPRTGGMSVNDVIEAIPRHNKPPEWGGDAKNIKMFTMDSCALPTGLVLTPDPRNPLHGLVEPELTMHLDQYQGLLASTRDSWQVVPPPGQAD